jgi:hypothetical protein
LILVAQPTITDGIGCDFRRTSSPALRLALNAGIPLDTAREALVNKIIEQEYLSLSGYR